MPRVHGSPATGGWTPLRFVYATIKINQELERIGDYAESVARQGLLINSLDVDIDYSKFKAISEISIPMLGNAVDAFLDQDADLAKSTMAVEKEANRLRDEINVDLFQLQADGKIPMEALTPLQTVARRFGACRRPIQEYLRRDTLHVHWPVYEAYWQGSVPCAVC